VDEHQGHSGPSPSLLEALAAFRAGDFAHARVGRLSDLARAESKILEDAWLSIPEDHRVTLVRRIEELSEERVELNFRRALRVAIEDPSAVVRQRAIAGLWEDDSEEFLSLLRKVLDTDPSPDVRAQAASGLERFSIAAVTGDLGAASAEEMRNHLLRTVKGMETPYGVQRRSLEALGPFGADPVVAEAINEAYDSGDHGLQCSAVYAMGKSQQARWLPLILAELGNDDPELRFEAARAAGALGSSDALSVLLEAARDEDAEVRHTAISAIGQVGGRGAVRALERLAEDAGDADLELIDAAIEEVDALLDPFQTSS
jgi:HEAT repeat protein